jgi:hypothetical protein
MRRLDQLLSHAAERGDRMGPERLIERLERRLAGEREVIVAAPPRRGAMVATREKPTPTTDLPKRPTTRWAIALAGFAVAIVAVVGAVILFGGSDGDVAAPETPAEVMALLATALEEVDAVQSTELSPPAGALQPGFLEWHLALGMNPEFSDCANLGSGVVMVKCSATMGDDFFFSVVLEENLPTTVTVRIDDDYATFDVMTWELAEGLAGVEFDMRDWIRETHPEIANRMFGWGVLDLVRFNQEAGQLHMQYLDEYLAYRKANS